MRSALRRGGLSAAVFGLAVLGQVAFAETVTLSLDQARHAAGQALLAGDPALAVALARRLLEAEPKDAYALLILAAGEQQMGDPASGRRDGRTAWAAAKGLPGLRYEIARHTALATLQSGAPIAAAFWLRRAVETAPDAAARSQSLQDLTTLRARSRLNYAFNLAMTPSANLNGGASGGFLIIDDSLIVGPLSGSAQALSGLRLAETLTASYGISASDQAVTRVGVQLFATQNSFSAAAKAQAPDLQAADLNQTTVEVNLAKDYLFTQDQPVPLSATLALGRSAVGGNDSGPYLRFGLNGPLAAGSDWVLSGRFGAERHWRTLDRIDATSFGLQQSRKLPGGSSIGWSVTTARVTGQAVNQTYDSLAAAMTYAKAKPVGPVTLSGSLSVGFDRYPLYMLGPFQVTNGRTDRHLDLAVTATFANWHVLGYAPNLTVNLGHTWSNISRYETDEISATLGYKSVF